MACLDQAVASGGLFLVHVVLARLLTAEAYGRFAVMLSAALIGAALLTALVLDPFSARGRGGRRYQGAAAVLVGLCGVVLAVPGMLPVSSAAPVDAVVAGLAAAPGLCLAWLARRAAYAAGRPGRALAVSLAMAVGSGGLLAILAGTGSATAARGLMALALAGFGAGLTWHWRWPGWRMVGAAARWHGHQGGWLAAGVPLWAMATQAPVLAVAWFSGPAAAGDLRVLQLVAMPIAQMTAAVGTFAQPRIAACAARGETGAACRQGLAVGGGLFAAAVLHIGLLAIGGAPVLSAIFGPAYAAQAPLAPLAALAPALACLAAGTNLALRALRLPRMVTVATACAAAAAAAGVAFVPAYGVAAALAALLMAALANLTAQSVALVRHRDAMRTVRA